MSSPSIIDRVATYWRLGPTNLMRVARYRLQMRLPQSRIRSLKAEVPTGRLLRESPAIAPDHPFWKETADWFSAHSVPISDNPPDWFSNPLKEQRIESPNRPWHEIPDFDPQVGDIKSVWEASRFDWVVAFALRGEVDRLNDWLTDWIEANPPYQGANWKCGQEASIRVLHLLAAAIILNQLDTPEETLLDWLSLHLKRIAPTTAYAMAQDNNHGTSEAVALFAGGLVLKQAGRSEGTIYARTGRDILENRVWRLVLDDGGFSQYSVVYHRLMLDAVNFAELIRRKIGAAEFSNYLQTRMSLATGWLWRLVNAETGDAPNYGANDGARILPITDHTYRDFRPVLQRGLALWNDRLAFPEIGADSLDRLGIPIPKFEHNTDPTSEGRASGYAVMSAGPARAMLRLPIHKFRPSQADGLHLDLWIGQINWLRDGGTFSYNSGQEWIDYFSGTAAHNTVMFDELNHMPRLSRFLFGRWTKAEGIQYSHDAGGNLIGVSASMRAQGGQLHRSILLSDNQLRVEDQVSGFSDKAVLRWRLPPGKWLLEGKSVSTNGFRLSVTAEGADLRLTEGWESRHYLEKTLIPVLEVDMKQAGAILTEACWS